MTDLTTNVDDLIAKLPEPSGPQPLTAQSGDEDILRALRPLDAFTGLVQQVPQDSDLRTLLHELPLDSRARVGAVFDQTQDPNALFRTVQEEFGRDRTILGEPGRGVTRAVRGAVTGGLAVGVGVGDALGLDTQALRAFIEERQTRTALKFEQLVPFEQAFDGPAEFVTWLAGATGEQVPVIASIVAGAGAGQLVGRALARGAISRGAANKALQFAVSHSGDLGAFAVASGLQVGSTAQEQLGATGTVDLGVAGVTGMAQGALEFVLPAMMARAFRITEPALHNRFLDALRRTADDLRTRPQRVASSLAKGATVEAATEVAQEMLAIASRKFVDENYDALGPEARERILQAAVTGGAVGGLFGAGTGALAPVFGFRGEAPPAQFTQGQGEPPPPVRPGQPPERPEPLAPRPPLAPANEEVPVLMTTAEGVTLGAPEFLTGVQAFSKYALATAQKGKDTTRFFRPKAGVPLETTALLRDVPLVAQVTEGTERVLFTSENNAPQAAHAMNEALRLRAEAVKVAAKDTTARDVTALSEWQRAEEAYQRAIDLGLRVMVPFEGAGFRLAEPLDPSQVEEVAYRPAPFIETPSSNVLMGTNVIAMTSPKVNTIALDFASGRPLPLFALGDDARFALAQKRTSDISTTGLKSFAVDVTRLDPDKLVIAHQFGLREMLGPLPIGDTLAVRTKLKELVASGVVTMPKDKTTHKGVMEKLVKAMTQPASSGTGHFRDALGRGVRIAAPELLNNSTIIRSLAYEGSPTSDEFRLASVQIPNVPGYVSRRGEIDVTMQFDTDVGVIDFMRKPGGMGPLLRADGTTVLVPNLLTQLQPGVTVFVDENAFPSGLNSLQKKHARHVRHIAEAIGKEFNLAKDQRVAVVLSRGFHGGGDFFGSKEGMSVIRFNLDHIQEGQAGLLQTHDTVFHEFGHAILHRELSKLDQGEYSQLLNAYIRDLFVADQLQGPLAMYTAVPRFLSIGVTGRVPITLEKVEPGASFAQSVEQTAVITGVQGDYLLSFAEWLANNMSKWAFSQADVQPLTTLQKWMQNLSQLMQRYWKTVVRIKDDLLPKGVEHFTPDEEFVRWVERIRAERTELVANNVLPSEAPIPQKPHMVQSLQVPSEEGAELHPAMALLDKIAHNMAPVEQARVQETAQQAQYFNKMVKWGYSIIQLAQLNPRLQPLQRYVSLAFNWNTERNDWLGRADEVLRDWIRLGTKQADALSRFIWEVEKMGYLSDEEFALAQWRRPTVEELNALAQRHGLSEHGKELYLQIVRDFDDFLGAIEQTAIDEVHRQFDGVVGAEGVIAAREQEIREQFAAHRQRPYFPHARFGDHAVIVKSTEGDKRTVYFEQFEGPLFTSGRRAALRAKGQLQGRLGTERFRRDVGLAPDEGVVIDVVKIPEDVRSFAGLPPSFLQMIQERLQLTEEQQFWLKQLVLDTASTTAFRKHLGKREGVEGYSRDAMRGYADYFFHGANHIARMRWGVLMGDQILQLQKDMGASLGSGEDLPNMRGIMEFMQDHHSHIMNPRAEYAAGRAAAFTWWIAGVPSSAALNLTQVPMVTAPYLSKWFGMSSTLGALRRAYRDVGLMKNNPDAYQARLSDADAALLSMAHRQGFITESFASEVAGVATAFTLNRLRQSSKLVSAALTFGRYGAWMFQAAEAVNRRVAFRAGVELARVHPEDARVQALVRRQALEYDQTRKALEEQGMDAATAAREAQAFLVGKDTVTSTQYEYASWARPRFMRGLPGLVFTFYMFVQNSLFFTLHQPGSMRYLVMLFGMAGMMGLPGADDLKNVAQFVGRKMFGKHFNIEHEVRRYVTELFGSETPAQLLLHGAGSTGFGLQQMADMTGMPLPVFDFSGALSMGRLVPGLSQIGPAGQSFEESVSRTATEAAGAFFGIGINVARMMSDSELPWSDPKRWERALPRAIRNVSKGVRQLKEGRERTRSGATLLEFDTWEQQAEAVMQMAGFTPARMTREWGRVEMQREAQTYWEQRRALLMDHYAHALLVAKDKDARADVMEDIRRYNREAPYKPMRITREVLERSIKERKRRIRLVEAGISPEKMFRSISREVNQLYTRDVATIKTG